MSVGAVGGGFTPVQQGFFSQDGDLLSRMNSLAEQRRTASDRNNFTGMSLETFLSTVNNATTTSNDFNRTLFANLGQVNTAANNLRSQVAAMASLSQFSASIGRTAETSNEGVLTASVAAGAVVSNHTRIDVNVRQIATGQENTSAALDADENSFGDRFSISITDNVGRTTAFNVDLGENADNRSALQDMAAQINASETGIRATVVEDEEAGTVSLQLVGSRTGETAGRFTVNDESAANLDNVTSAATNAQFTVNGTDFTSQTNEVTLQQGVTATLNETGSTQVTFRTDASTAVGSVQSFVDNFNSLRASAAGSDTLTRQLDQVARNFSGTLGFSGIEMNSEGRLAITDESRLTQAISDGSFARNFQGVGSLGDRLNNVSSTAFRTAYDSAVQENFRALMERDFGTNAANNTNNWINDWFSSMGSGLFFDMRI